ncbi:bola protein [Aspergillus cavernicola]|uniref:Bola protein n=1 Tax=Aspergillus cavernicola TaxID=176166 RepID=A0ABR4I765_9EURO
MPRPILPGLVFPRRLFTTTIPRMASTSSSTPVEDLIRDKISSAFTPTTLQVRNDSHLHAHHAPMRGTTSQETHFHVTITSPSFKSKPQPARHRMVYALLKEEMSREGGIHALQLRTKTPEEEQREKEREAQKQAQA